MNPTRQRFAWLLTLSLALHIAVLGWWSVSSLTKRPTETEFRVALVAEQQEAPAEAVEVLQQHLEPERAPEEEAVDTPLPDAPDEQAETLPPEEQTPSLPFDWRNRADYGREPTAEPDLALPFHPGRAAAVVQRRAEQQRAGLLARRSVQTQGREADEYNALIGSPDHIKTEKGCFDLVEERADPGLSRRWWMTRCAELLKSPFELAPLITDRLGRAVVE